MFAYEAADAMKRLKMSFFNAVVDCSIQSLEDRFQSLGQVRDNFGVLLNFSLLDPQARRDNVGFLGRNSHVEKKLTLMGLNWLQKWRVFQNSPKPDSGFNEENTDENTVRGNWTTKQEYTLSMIGYAIGLGNIWRFPYLAYKNGGGAFLIPYFIMLMLAGIPLFFLESAFGQFCSQGPINVWKAVPILQGTGVGMVMMNSLIAIYYGVIIAYSLYYMFASFQFPLPWSSCLSWADSNCSSTPIVKCNVTIPPASNWTQENGTCPPSHIITIPGQSPTEQYWDRVVLQRSSGFDETGPVVWHLALCLLLSLSIMAAVLCKGIKSSGKVVYFTATFPYVVLLILVIRGATLEGAQNGIEFYIGSKSNLTKLAESQIWGDAANQIFFSLSLAMGGVTTLASYNRFHNNVFQDTLIVTIVNCGTSVFAGFAIFSVLGHMAHVYRKPVEEVAQEGFSLAFIAYPEALSKLPLAPLWSVLFFFMLFVLGMDTEFALIEVITTCLTDVFPEIPTSKRPFIPAAACVLLFFLGLPCVTQAGIYWVTLMDQFVASWVMLLVAMLELVGLCYMYGCSRFIEDIEMMIGKRSAWFWLWWRACWLFICPCVLTVILVWSLAVFESPSYAGLQFPAWSLALGWCMAISCLLPVPVLAVYKVVRAEGSLWERLKSVSSPSEDWHPFLEIHRGGRYAEAQKDHGLPARLNPL
ncbi:sodium- and chloride-dependent neutral and basic amino acid transporter B(0+) [Lampris incognitus]|uniref:sodium- and chloride-dependent neutral and basic amino acid transporter B(0+) n=1 Tax=Lampris incognitus TaxID=2546036 RepID=UPI0024B4A8BB|nr:sodium- and chloride-dependent neutral and basic amino acid transporter B(0+) [Lampris incognitus]